MWVVFITDALLFALLGMVLGLVWFTRRHETLRAPWREVARRPQALAAALVLSLYALVGLLDSLHFHPRLADRPSGARYAGEVHSVLDVLIAPLRQRTETSYSAPLASRDWSRSVIEGPDGSQGRGFARLRWGGAHLEDPAVESTPDVVRRILGGGGAGLCIYALFLAGVFFVSAGGNIRRAGALALAVLRDRLPIPWYAPLLVGLLLALVCGAVASLAGGYHVLGTDKVGQDVLYQCLKSIRTGLVIGTLTTLIMMPFAVLLGLSAGYFRGWLDDAVQYLYTTLSSIPGVLLIAASILMVQVFFANHPDVFDSVELRADLRLLFLCVILGITSWTGLCRLLRGEALKLREMDYVQAALALGVSRGRILLRHLLPNVAHLVIIAVVLDFSALVLAEAVLSYVNIGVDPTSHSWGNMINSARLELSREPVIWWSLGGALFFMLLLVLAANLFADAVRDAFDPRLRPAL